MTIIYGDNELAADIRSLEERGIETEVAKELAEFKTLIDCAANTWYALLGADEDAVPEEVFEPFSYAHALLEDAYKEVEGLFPEQ